MPLEALEEREANRLGTPDRSTVLGGSKGDEPAEPVDVEAGLETVGTAVGKSQKRKSADDNVSDMNAFSRTDCTVSSVNIA